ncbi:MAG: flagellar assembly protein T N-terminal domain-containing protein [Deltaproteobacteria bacterium]|mgnify:CR=1 FL=1|nr:flagellar assembly protein T N-terminal domain-containing protein [Deltaproteobacteria bacterium]MBW2019830.1 flagellar assembly protein T N-terminal domain-containing protein [Deltaproteobacteria bacterium]MBW2074634.1 flagellar assembly protein T N-terminal domain-containing protein [Deltaproteobacteria bacterium]RLB81992.1 MAG: hypothetical protein DRH17_07365 [Deltaproteobacteria bacterium]
MTDFRKHLILILLLLGCASGFNGAWAQDALRPEESAPPTDALSPNQPPAQRLSELASGSEAGQAASEDRTIDVIGTGIIYGDDVARARDEAIADALRGVVEEAVGLVISPASVVQNFQLLSERLYDQAEAFIHDYKVLTESKSGRHYRVVVRATIFMSTIRDKLQSIGILMIHKEMPTIMFFLSEQNIGEPSPQYWWGQGSPSAYRSVTENTLSEYMRNKDFIIVDRTVRGPDIEFGPEYMGPELSDDAAVMLGKAFGADVVIAGKALARYSGNVFRGDMQPIQATVSVRAIRTDSGMAIASSQETRATVHSDGRVGGTEALILSASRVAQDLTRQIVANWRKEARQPVVVELVVRGIKEYADFVRFRAHIRNEVQGVKNIYLRSIRAGEAKMDLEFMGNAGILADELMLQRFENLTVNILEVSEEAIKLELIPRDD